MERVGKGGKTKGMKEGRKGERKGEPRKKRWNVREMEEKMKED